MIAIRKSEERGVSQLGWLDSKHSFSFGEYYDPQHMSFGPLRVLNDDRVAPGMGFGEHPHDNMEIVSYVLSGALEHKDSLGTGSVIKPGDVQRMSAGSGITHSEFNHSSEQSVHFLQIWFFPKTKNIPPSYEQKYFSPDDKRGKLLLVGSETGRDGSVVIHQDINMYACLLDGADSIAYTPKQDRKIYLHVARGLLNINGLALKEGDAVLMFDETISLEHAKGAEIILFDMGL